jgi:positive regulator of sigma E activity
MAFTIVFIQELVQGKGVVVGLQEGDPVNQAVLGGFVVTTLGLAVWLAIKGNDDYTKQES